MPSFRDYVEVMSDYDYGRRLRQVRQGLGARNRGTSSSRGWGRGERGVREVRRKTRRVSKSNMEATQ